jgi:hypothetical protein
MGGKFILFRSTDMGRAIQFPLFTLAFALASIPAVAQTTGVVFSYKNASSATPVTVASNGTIDVGSTSPGSPILTTVTISNRDTVAWTVGSIFISTGPFQLTETSAVVIQPGQDKTYGVSFNPPARGLASGSLGVRLISGSRTLAADFILTGAGIESNLVCSYILAADGNQILLGDNDTINFPRTQIGQSSTGTFIIANSGNAPGTVGSVVLPAGVFRISGLPLLPTQVEGGKEIRFTVAFSPTVPQSAAAQIQVAFPNRTRTFNLAGQGIGASFVYEATVGSSTTAVDANGTISLPSTSIGATSPATIRIRNTGNGDGQVAVIAISGAGFQLTDLPVLPATVAAGQSVAFTVVFSPTQSGAAQGRLRIDNAFITITGNGLGAVLSFAAVQGTTVAPLADNGAVTFPNTAVGSSAGALIQISNNGNTATRISSINVIGDAYSLANTPPLPATIDPGQRIEFGVNFSPSAVAAATGLLQVDGVRINLTGVGLPPPALPAVSFSGLSDSSEPAQQPTFSLTLAAPYPLDISGRVNIGFSSEAFVDDQAIQFSTGGRTVSFTIPANTTQAVFGSDARQMQFQTGTVAGTITLTATFATGSVNLTPAPAPAKTMVIAASAPRIRTVQIGARTASSFEVIVTGLSTARSVTGLDLQFAASPGTILQTTSLSLNVEGAFSGWYLGASSAPFGSQFTAVITISVSGDMNAVQSVAVTAKNQRGASSAVSASLR